MKIAVVDDEEIWRNSVTEQIDKYFGKEKTEVLLFTSGKEFLESKEKYDIVMLDIEMPELDGFQTAEQYREFYPEGIIIILTTHTEMSRKGYLVNAFRYLDKMNLKEELTEALDSVKRLQVRNRSVSIPIVNLGEQKIVLKDILYVETEKRNTLIHTRDTKYVSSLNIGKIEEVLDESIFFKCHKSFIVNLDMIRSFDHVFAELVDGSRVYVSSRSYAELKRRYMERKFEIANA